MERCPIIAANWKMNITKSEAKVFIDSFIPLVSKNKTVEKVICPPATSIDSTINLLKGTDILVGGQNIYFEENGAFTGENSAAMLKDLGCTYVILGHSERRSIFNESNEIINKKIKRALLSGLKVILCIGETLSERESNQTEIVITNHIKGSLKDISKSDMKNIVIAYEPVWAIGTGKTATPLQAEEAHAYTRKLISELYDIETAKAIRIQYGGSVKPDNVKELMNQPNIDGALVGGASLKPDSFAKLINYAD